MDRNRGRASFILDRLEGRCLLTVFFGNAGAVIGETVPYTPPGGVIETAPNASRATNDSATGSFDITLDFSGGGLTASQQAIFASAAARWESIITADLPDVGTVDDVKIFASGRAIDGVGTILGQSGYTAVRSNTQLPYMGTMAFDSDDLASMEANGQLNAVITHEMGHVLGIGSLWTRVGLNLGTGTADSRFIGTNAVAEYQRFMGDASLTSIPVETDYGPGTADAHWDDATFGNELMTGILSAGSNPLSRMSAASLMDLGYGGVNLDAADLYTMANTLPTVGTLAASTALLGQPISLSLSSANDADGIGAVNFYRESNGLPGLQATGSAAPDTLVASGTALNAQASTAGLGLGTYTFYARATDAKGAYSAIATTSATVVNATLPVTPAAPDLADASDTGDSNADNITAANRPSFIGVGTPGSTVSLLADGSVVGTSTADAFGRYTVIPASTIADGLHAFSVTSTVGLLASANSSALVVAIDTTGGTVQSIVYDRERTQHVSLTLNDPTLAGRFAAERVTVLNQTTGASFVLHVVDVNAATGAVTLAAAATLADGRYVVSVPTRAVTDVAGNALTAASSLTFSTLAGDANGDGAVNFNDLILLARNYGATSGRTASTGNVDYSVDGAVGFSDLILLARKYGDTLSGTNVLAASANDSSVQEALLVSKGTRKRTLAYAATFAG